MAAAGTVGKESCSLRTEVDVPWKTGVSWSNRWTYSSDRWVSGSGSGSGDRVCLSVAGQGTERVRALLRMSDVAGFW